MLHRFLLQCIAAGGRIRSALHGVAQNILSLTLISGHDHQLQVLFLNKAVAVSLQTALSHSV